MMSADRDVMSTVDAGMASGCDPMVDSTVMPCECDGRQICEDGVCTEPEMCMGHEIVSETEFAKTAPTWMQRGWGLPTSAWM